MLLFIVPTLHRQKCGGIDIAIIEERLIQRAFAHTCEHDKKQNQYG